MTWSDLVTLMSRSKSMRLSSLRNMSSRAVNRPIRWVTSLLASWSKTRRTAAKKVTVRWKRKPREWCPAKTWTSSNSPRRISQGNRNSIMVREFHWRKNQSSQSAMPKVKSQRYNESCRYRPPMSTVWWARTWLRILWTHHRGRPQI